MLATSGLELNFGGGATGCATAVHHLMHADPGAPPNYQYLLRGRAR